MRQVVVYADGVTVEIAERPQPRPGEVLVRSLLAGVCGSDLHAAGGSHPFVAMPYRPGHEVVGIVVELGPQVDSVRVGERITLEPFLPCWSCKMCQSGRQNLCERLQFFGCGYEQGGMADYFTVPAHRLHVVPEALDDRAAALIEPLATPVHAVRLAGDVEGKAVVILGAGTIGLLLLAVLRAHGPARIVVTDPLPDKRKRALELGADAVVDPTSPDTARRVRDELGESADVVFDCVAIASSVEQAIALADKGGTVVIVGVPAREVTIPLPIIQDHQIRIQGSATYLPEDFAESMRLLESGAVAAAEYVTAVIPIGDVARAFALAAAGHQLKVLISIAES